MPFPSAISAAVAAILPHLSHQVRKILLTIFFSIRMGTIFMIEVSFAQMSVIKCISHVLETILGAFHRNRKLIPKGPSHSALRSASHIVFINSTIHAIFPTSQIVEKRAYSPISMTSQC